MKQDKLVEEKLKTILTLIEGNDKNYLTKFEDSKEAVTAAIIAQKLAVDSAFVSSQEAIRKSEVAIDKHFDSVNEFRKTLSDQTKSFITFADHESLRREFLALADRNTKDIKELQLTGATLAGKASQSDVSRIASQSLTSILLASIGLIISLITVILRLTGR
jgi:hypothetical protein